MWFKAVVMEIKDKYAIVLKSNSTMERVKIKDNMKVGDILIFLEDDRYIEKEKNTMRNKMILTIVSIAAVFALFILPMLNKEVSPYAVVSLDINPSIQLELDENKKIINVNPLNNDGKNLEIKNIKGLSLDEGILKLKTALQSNEYKLINNSIIVGFAFLGEKEDINYENYIKDIVGKSLNESNIDYLKGSKEDYLKASKNGVSIGRYLKEESLDNIKEEPEVKIEENYKEHKNEKDEKENTTKDEEKINYNYDDKYNKEDEDDDKEDDDNDKKEDDDDDKEEDDD